MAVEPIEKAIKFRGSISGVDQSPYQFFFITRDQNKLSIPFDSQWFDTIETAVREYKNEARVMVKGTGVFSTPDRLDRVINIESITLLDKKDVPTCLEKFLGYQDGWMDGEGGRYTKDDIDWLSDQYDQYFGSDILQPFTFPTVSGGVEFEWINGPHDATLEIELVDKSAYFHYYNKETKEDSERDFDLSSPDDWTTLVAIASNYFKI